MTRLADLESRLARLDARELELMGCPLHQRVWCWEARKKLWAELESARRWEKRAGVKQIGGG